MPTLSAANSRLSIAVVGLFSSPQAIQGFDVDDSFTATAIDNAETRMGVDGRLSGGKVYVPYPMMIKLQATSPSVGMFDTWGTQEDAIGDVFIAEGSIFLPSIGRVYTLQNGFLTKKTPFPAVKKILQAVEYEVTWERIISTPTA